MAPEASRCRTAGSTCHLPERCVPEERKTWPRQMRTSWPSARRPATWRRWTTRHPRSRSRLRSSAATRASRTTCDCRGWPPGSQMGRWAVGTPAGRRAGSSSRSSTSSNQAAAVAQKSQPSPIGSTSGGSVGCKPTVGTKRRPFVARRSREDTISRRPAPLRARHKAGWPAARAASSSQACTKARSQPSLTPSPRARPSSVGQRPVSVRRVPPGLARSRARTTFLSQESLRATS
mmetsp:Transcript_40104/g.115715  ORF Transcript_40104/g.115715 Transcript_40104/m.115715 type:complete len:234 (-) Transcript_40104:272-973(-)